jgi:hypothetical protein
VCHDRRIYRPGETAELPDKLATEWLTSGWVEQVGGKARSAKASAQQPADKAQG